MIVAVWVWALLAAFGGYWITVGMALGVSVALALLMRVLLVSTDVSPEVGFDAEGTVIRPDIRIERSLREMTGIGAFVSWVGLVSAFPFGAVYVPLFSELPESFYVIPAWCSVAALGLTWLWWGYRRRGISFLFLSPDGFHFPALATDKIGEWKDIVDIRTELPNGQGRFWAPLVLMMKSGSYCALESPGIYTPGGTAVVELVRHYWQHPQDRDELTDGRAIERLQQLTRPKS